MQTDRDIEGHIKRERGTYIERRGDTEGDIDNTGHVISEVVFAIITMLALVQASLSIHSGQARAGPRCPFPKPSSSMHYRSPAHVKTNL